jgi:uncharacterized protein involved in type VI secretion and phage assembly
MTSSLFGAHLGIIADTADPTGKGRVKVRFPALPLESDVWARVCKPFGAPAGKPQIGAEVAVIFAMGDPRHPIVVGKLQD